MKFRTLLCPFLLLIATTIGQIHSLNEKAMDTFIFPTEKLWDPTLKSSSGILKSHLVFNYDTNFDKTVTLQAPGFAILAALRLLDLRPNNQDSLTLFIPGRNVKKTFTNPLTFKNKTEDINENKELFFSETGELGVTFKTGGSSPPTKGYEGFKIVYTVQALSPCENKDYFTCKNGRCINKHLKCDGHNHCGDRSDQMDCDTIDIEIPGFTIDISGGTIRPKIVVPKKFVTTAGTIAGIVCGVFFGLLILGGVIAFIIFRRATARSRTQGTVINRAHK